nr:hypothetical protein [Rhodococcus sp. 15-1154-1]
MGDTVPFPGSTPPQVLGYIVGTTEHDWVLRLTLGDSEGTLHSTLDQAEAELIQVWAEGGDDHEVFEIRALSPRRR